jgi:glycosyltransferase involved in cell wall biosynthesis
LLARAVESVAGRTDLEGEIIIVDDGSTDDTPAVCAELARRHAAVRVIRQPNGGLSHARNTGIRAASGRFIHFLDADDYIDAAMYGVMAAALADDRHAHVAYCGFEIIGASEGEGLKSEGEPVAGDMGQRLRRGNLGPVHSFLVRREAVDAAGFFDEQLKSCEDWDYWLRIAILGYRFVHVPGIFAYYERQPYSMSRNYPVMIRSARTVLAKAHSPRAAVDLAPIRRGFFDYVYAGVLRNRLQSGSFGWVAREGLRLLRADPRSVPLLLAFLVHHKRVIAHGARAAVMRAGRKTRGGAERSPVDTKASE